MQVQDEHYHPSDRVGLVVNGHGTAHTESGEYALKSGVAWHLPPGERHFFTTTSDVLDIIVFHPDSLWGPTDESHAMLDATLGVGDPSFRDREYDGTRMLYTAPGLEEADTVIHTPAREIAVVTQI